MGLIKEVKTFGFEVFSEEPIVHCKEFEDNSGAIDISRLPKICPCTKHLNVVFHHFHEYLHKGIIHIQLFCMNDQCADSWTKLLQHNVLLKHRKMIFVS